MRTTRIGERALSILQWSLTLSSSYTSSLSCHTCPAVGSLVGRRVTFLDMPLVTLETVKGVQVGQRTKLGRFAKQLHRPHAVMAARSFGRGRISVGHDTISSSPLHVVRVHYQRVAKSLILGNASLRGPRGDNGAAALLALHKLTRAKERVPRDNQNGEPARAGRASSK